MSRPSDVKPWFREDIAYILAGIAMAHHAQSVPSSLGEQRGFLSAIAALGKTFGIDLRSILTPEELQLIFGPDVGRGQDGIQQGSAGQRN